MAAVAAWLSAGRAGGITLDANFSESVFANAGLELTGMAWAPDGSDRLFVTRKGGQIVVIKNGARLPTPFATVSPIFTHSECGLLGICFDPNFMMNGHVYVFVTVSSGEQQILRYTAIGDIGTNRTVIVSNLPTIGATHDGGAVGVGADGKLYWAVGDNGYGLGANADLSSLTSKVGRANLDGSVPADNPFADGPGGNNDYIWARGFRNPFTLAFQPDTGLLWVNCVGAGYEQIFQVNRGDHAGWNTYENNQPAGFIRPRIKYRTNGTDTRSIVGGTGAVRKDNVATFTTTTLHGFCLGEKITIAGVADASFNGVVYVALAPSDTTFTAAQSGADATSGGGTATTLDQGGCVTGGIFYDGTGVPAAYRGNFFYGDFNSGRIMRATLNSSTNIVTVDYIVSNVPAQIDTAVGPDGALYYGILDGTVYRLAYTNFPGQQLIVTPATVRMLENGAAAVAVRLAKAPAGNVQVSVTRTSGDPNINVTSGATLTFTPENWSVPQVARVNAAADGDATNGIAGLTVSSAGLTSETVTVHALDRFAPFSLGITNGAGSGPIEVRLTGEPGRTYIVERNTNLLPPSLWTPLATNTLTGTFTNVVDEESRNFPRRFYRARVAP